MASRGQVCEACGRKRGHEPGCVNAAKCPECGLTVGHKPDCKQAVTLDGKTGSVVIPSDDAMATSDLQSLADMMATQFVIRARFEERREHWTKLVKTCNDTISRIERAIAARGHESEAQLDRLEKALNANGATKLPLEPGGTK